MVKNKDMNWLQRLYFGVRWRISTKTCQTCNGNGEDKLDPLFECAECHGTGLERIIACNTGAFDADIIDIGYNVEIKGVFCNDPSSIVYKEYK